MTAARRSLPSIDGVACNLQWICSRPPLPLLLLLAIVLAGLFLHRQTLRRRLPQHHQASGSPAGADVTWPPAAAPLHRLLASASSALPKPWVRRDQQGQAPREKRASTLTVSTGGRASGTAAGGAARSKGRSMEGGQEKRASSAAAAAADADGSGSRGVSSISTDCWSGAHHHQQALSFGEPDLALVPGERSSGHVRTSHVYDAAGSRENIGHRMEDVGLAGVRDGRAFGPVAVHGAPGLDSTFFLAHRVMDDEHILYSANGAAYMDATAGGWASRGAQQSEPDFTPSPSQLLTPTTSTAGSSSGVVATHVEHPRSMAIPLRASTGGYDQPLYHPAEDTASPSSYPPTSPLLPPPPATTYDAFDPAAVMFPGPARDGGIKMVPVDVHLKGGLGQHTHGEVLGGAAGDPGTSWKRHTRVYGGGVCLACVAAAGEGGFYGDSVRPQDKR